MESSQVRALSKRIPLWDNAKGILIFLVVTGHFLMYIQGNINAQRMLIMIYLFHMPAFIFISGLMSQRAILEHNHKKALYFLEIFLVIKAWMIIVRLISGNFDAGILNLMEMDDVSWYAFSLAVFYIVAMAFSECNKRAVIMISVAVACLVGYCDSIGTFFLCREFLCFFQYSTWGFVFTDNLYRASIQTCF